MIAMQNNRAPATHKPCAWSNDDGEFGIAIRDYDPDLSNNPFNPYIMTIEMSPDDMIEMARDMLILGVQKKEQEHKAEAEKAIREFIGQ